METLCKYLGDCYTEFEQHKNTHYLNPFVHIGLQNDYNLNETNEVLRAKRTNEIKLLQRIIQQVLFCFYSPSILCSSINRTINSSSECVHMLFLKLAVSE